MKYSRVVINRIPPERRKDAMPDATNDERVEEQTPVSCWLEVPQAYQLLLWLQQNYPILTTDGRSILVYGTQHADWPEGTIPPAPAPFDLAAVGRAHASWKEAVIPTGPAFGITEWEEIRLALKAVQGERKKGAQRILRSVRGHLANLHAKEEKMESRRAKD